MAVHFDDVNQAILTVFQDGYYLQGKGVQLSQESLNFLSLMRDWYSRGGHCSTEEPYFAGAYHIQRQFRLAQAGPLHDVYGGGESGLCYFLKTLAGRLRMNPGASLDPAEIAYIDNSLKTGWRTAVGQYGTDPTLWQSSFNQSIGRLAVPYGVNLEGFPSLDPTLDFISEVLKDPEGGTIWSQKGNSYTQWVDLSDVDRSLAVLPVGITENPAGVFFRAEQKLWERGELRSAPLSRGTLERMAFTTIKFQYR
jgi:penicillin amidase